MAVAAKLPAIILSIRRFLVRALRAGNLRQALKWLLGRLAVHWTIIRSRWSLSNKKTQTIDSPPAPPSPGRGSGETIGESDGQKVAKKPLETELEFTHVIDGETISLVGIMPSVFPLPGDGMRSASRSSRNLQASRSAHSSTLSLASRNPSQQSLNARGSNYAGSKYSNSSISVNVIEPDSPASNVDTGPTLVGPIDTNPSRSPYLQPIDTSAPSRSSSGLGHADAVSGKTSPTLDDRGSNASLRHSPASPSTTDDRHSLKSSKSEGGYEIDEPANSSSHKAFSIYGYGPQFGSCIALSNDRITPVMPEAIPRYTGRPIIRREGVETMAIQPLTKRFSKPEPPPGWEKCIHPEGACYFYNEKKSIYAEADLHDVAIYSQAMQDITTIEDFVTSQSINIDKDTTDLVLCLVKESDGTISTLYYYVHHDTRSIFFLDVYQASSLEAWPQVACGATSESHLKHEIETQYWYHCQFYPHSSKLTTEKVQELRDVVMHCIGDTMTSPKGSTAPYALDELRSILALTGDMDKNVGGVSVGTHSCFARLMFIFARARFLHFHGESHARIDRTTSVYGDDVFLRTWLVKALSPFLFCAPDFHLKNLQSMWVDETMHKSVLKESMDRMNQEWDQFVLFATVMLNANVAFLAIQSVDNGPNHPQRSAAQIASYVSIVASIGSIVLGLLLSRQNRTKLRETVDEFERYMTERRHPTLGLETLAILYSLPYALLMWGMVSFLLAIAFLCFMISDTITVSIVGASSSFCVMLILWCVHTNWEKEENAQACSEATIAGRLSVAISDILPSFGFGRWLRASQRTHLPCHDPKQVRDATVC